MIDEELTRPEAFSLAVRSRASYLARGTLYKPQMLRPFAQLTLLLGIELDEVSEEPRSRGLRRAYRWVMSLERALS